MEKIRDHVVTIFARFKAFLRRWVGPPAKKEIRSWVVDDSPAPTMKETGGSLWELWGRFAGFWGRVRTRVFRAAAGILALVCVALGVLFYSNIWYLNLILYAFLVPNTLILLHYLRLTRHRV